MVQDSWFRGGESQPLAGGAAGVFASTTSIGGAGCALCGLESCAGVRPARERFRALPRAAGYGVLVAPLDLGQGLGIAVEEQSSCRHRPRVLGTGEHPVQLRSSRAGRARAVIGVQHNPDVRGESLASGCGPRETSRDHGPATGLVQKDGEDTGAAGGHGFPLTRRIGRAAGEARRHDDASVRRSDTSPPRAASEPVEKRPRKVLAWKTPAETLDERLQSLHQPGVATTG
jgi:hypothetical protein